MARKKARQRISYVLPLANSPGGHRLGVNSLAVDSDHSILYSAGRDGVICSWDLDLPLQHRTSPSSPRPAVNKKATTFRDQVQPHTHWVNDILLAQNNQALVSASSDITVKVWRPQAQDGSTPATIGLHNDYVKCLASPGTHSDWVASGGLDHKIRVWDLNGGGEKLQVDAGEDEGSQKGSVYALSVRGSIMASGGPESILRLWDPRTGKRITKFVGHTDNIRDILINETGDMVMTASSDQTIKIWSMAAGRCMNTLTMHNDSVWSLYSDHPQLGVFYSSDRSGLVAKTDVRGSVSMDEGISVAVAQEHEGVAKVVVAGDYIWTATSSSSINRWSDVDTTAEVQTADSPRQNRLSSLVTRPKLPSPPPSEAPLTNGPDHESKKIPLASILKISNAVAPKLRDIEASTVYSGNTGRKPSEAIIDIEIDQSTPMQSLPEETIEGQNGLIKHVMLNDRKRVLTLDTAGDVVLWDLIKCAAIESFGKRHLEDVTPEVNTQESVANWCTVDTRTGKLAVALEENYCFDAEMYADETNMKETSEFREDQRINLGKWVLRYLFTSLIDEEIKRDEAHRTSLRQSKPATDSKGPKIPRLGTLPANPITTWNEDDSAITPRPMNGQFPTTPGLAIGVATPGAAAVSSVGAATSAGLTTDDGNELKKVGSGHPRTSGDYFSSNPPPPPPNADKTANPSGEENPTSPTEATDKDAKSSGLFGKKFRMNMAFPKKLGRTSVEVSKPAPAEDTKSEDSTDDKSDEKEDKIVEDNFYGIIQKIRNEYEEILETNPDNPLNSAVTPSLPNETPVLKLPPFTTIIIQEDRPESGGLEDLYRGTIRSVGQDASVIEKVAPMWLGDLLLRNQTPIKDIVKVSFVLLPFNDLLKGIAGSDGNSRLNANRMLRAKKILGYVTERIDEEERELRPEEYLELWCQGQLIPPNMTLATVRAYVWKTGGDVMLYYKSNGRKPELEQKWAEEKAKAEQEAAKVGAASEVVGGTGEGNAVAAAS